MTSRAALLLLLLAACRGAPARIVVAASDSLVLNNERPVRLPARVLDERGHVIPDTGVRWARIGGDAIPVSTSGEIDCASAGDVTVRASVGDVVTTVHVLCRPLHLLQGGMLELVLGDSASELPIVALDSAKRPVRQLAGTLKILDSSVVRVNGLKVYPRAAGTTAIGFRAGERFTWVHVVVFERASSPEHVRPDQNVAVAVQLASGEMKRWRLAAGRYVLSVRGVPDDDVKRPRLAVQNAWCDPSFGGFFCTSRGDASVIVYRPLERGAAPMLAGELLVQRIPDFR